MLYNLQVTKFSRGIVVKKFVVITLFCSLLIFAVLSCGPPKEIETAVKYPCSPKGLVIDSISSKYAKIGWNPGCKGTRILRGFNIYLLPAPLETMSENGALPEGIEPFNKLTYPGDVEGNPNHETYEIKGIENALYYYVHIRTVNSDGTLSQPSNEVELVTVARGEIAMGLSHTGMRDGFSLAQAEYSSTNDLANDFYIFSKDSQFFLCSPARLSPVNRNTRIYELGSAKQIGDLPVDLPEGAGEGVEKVRVVNMGLYLLVTEEGHQAKLRMKYSSGRGAKLRVYFEYLYQPPARRQDGSGS